MTYHLAIDIGASGGRHILGWLDDGRLYTREIYRFENGVKQKDGFLTWDTDYLFEQVIKGLALCKLQNRIPKTLAIDTWGVDYVLLDGCKREILPAIAYRDGSTSLIQNEVAKIVSKDYLYQRTGIQHQSFNTLYRLYCDKKDGRLGKATYMLMMPEYLSFKLTGRMGHEYTNATTTGLINAASGDWDYDIINKLEFPLHLFNKPLQSPCCLGGFSSEIQAKVGFNAEVLFCPSHDTASAVMSCPMEGSAAYISSGTWSLVGIENDVPITNERAKNANLTNEGGVFGTYRFLKNIMGMWLFQGVRRSLNNEFSYDQMMNLAQESSYDTVFDPNDHSLTAPADMLYAIRQLVKEPALALNDVLSSIYHSLACSYARTIKEIEEISDKRIVAIHIIGGGSKDAYLNKLTSMYTKKPVFAGPVEATSAGNLLSQIMYCDDSIGLETARKIIANSFTITKIYGE